jgi:hypothetical protein
MPLEISQPCARCGGDDFIVLEDVEARVWVNGAHDGNEDPYFSLVACARCGRSEWFARDLATVANHEGARRVRLGDGGYRSPG